MSTKILVLWAMLPPPDVLPTSRTLMCCSPRTAWGVPLGTCKKTVTRSRAVQEQWCHRWVVKGIC